MSRLTRALDAASMAVAAAGGGLLIAAAGAVPAYAAAPVPSPGGRPGGHVVATITLRPGARAASGAGPSVIHPCAMKPGATPAYGDGDGCDSGIVTCDVIADAPAQSPVTGNLIFSAATRCSEDVPQISMGQDVIHSTPIIPGNPLTDSKVVTNDHFATTQNIAVCQAGQYAVSASAHITPPDGDILTGSLQDTSATITFTCGGGGGDGCDVAAPPASGQTVGRHPDLIVCR